MALRVGSSVSTEATTEAAATGQTQNEQCMGQQGRARQVLVRYSTRATIAAASARLAAATANALWRTGTQPEKHAWNRWWQK